MKKDYGDYEDSDLTYGTTESLASGGFAHMEFFLNPGKCDFGDGGSDPDHFASIGFKDKGGFRFNVHLRDQEGNSISHDDPSSVSINWKGCMDRHQVVEGLRWMADRLESRHQSQHIPQKKEG